MGVTDSDACSNGNSVVRSVLLKNGFVMLFVCCGCKGGISNIGMMRVWSIIRCQRVHSPWNTSKLK